MLNFSSLVANFGRSFESSVRWQRLPKDVDSVGSDDPSHDAFNGQLYESEREEEKAVSMARKKRTILNISLIANAVLLLFLILSFVAADLERSLVHSSAWWSSRLEPSNIPYNPIREAGALKMVLKKFEKNHALQGDPGHETDMAWENILYWQNGIVGLPEEMMEKMPHEGVEAWWAPGKHGYVLSMYHQLHCLNAVRKQFDPDQWASINSSAHIEHRKHCFDYIAQGILCTGDTTMDYYWRKAWDEVGPDGKSRHSKVYEQKNLRELSDEAGTQWEVVHQCRDLDALHAWMEQYALPDEPKVG